MKALNKFLFCTALLAGATGFYSCSNDDIVDQGTVNPTFDGESVKTQFAINIPAGKSTRLGQDIVQGQEQPLFRGMENIKLIPFKTTPADGGVGLTPISLGAILTDELGAGTNAKVYYDVPIEIDVNNFLFYGEAKVDNGGSKENGSLKATISETVNNIKFELEQISKDATSNSQATTLINALNSVAGVQDGSGKLWSASTSDLKKYYNTLLRLKAGSATSIRLALTDLKEGINKVTATGEEDLKAAIITAIDQALSDITDVTYPRNINLPDGAAQVQWVTDRFEYINSKNVGTLSYTAMENFVYPTSLYYWVNTPIKCSNEAQADNYTTDWNACLGLYDDGASVTSSTLSVALEKSIQYAVGRMDIAARFNAANVSDNLGATVNVNNEGGINLKGILIGGQKNLKWDFNTPVTEPDVEYTVYDAAITSTPITEASISAVQAYSLALQSAQGTEVRFALELENNTGVAFTGKEGIVPNGSRFYLVGKLTPVSGTADNRVFYQDYITYAKVTINSLENAYNCIPDLKNPKLELGLSVDLTWEKGLEQEVTIE